MNDAKINKNQERPDVLEDLFKQLPEEELPVSFRANVMRQVMQEAMKAKKRSERLSLVAVILASLAMVALAVLSFLYMGLPEIDMPHFPQPQWDPSALLFYLYIGILTLCLLLADYMLRKAFYKDK